MKDVLGTVGAVLIGIALGLVVSAGSALIVAFILGFVLDPFLAIIKVPVLTERLSGLSFGERFILVFTIQFLCALMPGQSNKKTGDGQ
jgi:hypothetical protein